MDKKIPPNKSKEGIFKQNKNTIVHESLMGHEYIDSGDDVKSSFLHKNNSCSCDFDNLQKMDLRKFSIKDCDPKLVDDITKDLEILKKNPKLAKQSDKIFEKIHRKSKKETDKNPYDTATQCQIEFLNEFKKD